MFILLLAIGSQFEEDFHAYYLLAELQVGEKNRRGKPQQNLYSHSVLMDIPKKSHLPKGASPLQPVTQSENHVAASFHAIISHKYFMSLITGPHLTLTFTIKNYLHKS